MSREPRGLAPSPQPELRFRADKPSAQLARVLLLFFIISQ